MEQHLTKPNIPSQWGFHMDLDGPALCHAIHEIVQRSGTCDYLEFGFAEGGTMKAVADFLLAYLPRPNYRVIGIELENGWSLHKDRCRERFVHHEYHFNWIDWIENTVGETIRIGKNDFRGAVTVLFGDARKLIAEKFENDSIDLALIDACHATGCVIADFEAVAPKIRRGGMVAFHDTNDFIQNQSPQAHCGKPIGVKQALWMLGLSDRSDLNWSPFYVSNHLGQGGMHIYKKR